MNELQVLQETTQMCDILIKNTHYAKMGIHGIRSIIDTSRSLGIPAMQGLSGALHYMNGKVTISAGLMNCLIRKSGHSLTIDKRSNDQTCILHGKRKDTGDTCTVSFSIADAKLAKLNTDVWTKYPSDMLFNRALSRLGRRLFPDVICGCYVEGEIPEGGNPDNNHKISPENLHITECEVVEKTFEISPQEAETLELLLSKEGNDYREMIIERVKKVFKSDSLQSMSRSAYDITINAINRRLKEKSEKIMSVNFGEQQQMSTAQG